MFQQPCLLASTTATKQQHVAAVPLLEQEEIGADVEEVGMVNVIIIVIMIIVSLSISIIITIMIRVLIDIMNIIIIIVIITIITIITITITIILPYHNHQEKCYYPHTQLVATITMNTNKPHCRP